MLRIIDQLLYCQEAIIRTNINERHHKHLAYYLYFMYWLNYRTRGHLLLYY